MASEFMKRGYHVISGGTDNHMMLIDLRSKNITGKDAENALVAAEITVNKNMVPFDDKSPFITSGIRVGTAAMTTRGLREDDFTAVVDLIDTVLTHSTNSSVIKEVKGKVHDMMQQFPLY